KNVDWAEHSQYKANFHAHSRNSDGSNTTVEMVEDHYAKGFDILAMTDHNYITESCDKVNLGPMTSERRDEVLSGIGRDGKPMIEISFTDEQSATDHINTFWANFNNVGGDTMASILDKTEKIAGISHINHAGRYTGGSSSNDEQSIASSNNPAAIKKYIDLFRAYPSCVGMEIINKIDNESKSERILWDNILKEMMPEGRNVWGFSNDDTHSLNATGYSWNVMLMPELNQVETRKAMETGAFYAVSRVSRLDNINRKLPNGNEMPGSGTSSTLYLLDQPTPSISSIAVHGGEITIAGSNYDLIEWIADGAVIATGNLINLSDYQDKVGSYVRAQLKSTTGIAFTQPFGVAEYIPFAAENLTLTPGKTEREMNFTWNSDVESGMATTVQIARKAGLAADAFPAWGIITATGTAGNASAGKSWHKAAVTGLEPGIEYVYRVSNDNSSYSQIYSFKTAAAGDFQFIAVGDPQLTTGNQDSDSVWPRPVRTTREGWIDTMGKISQQAPDAAFMAGTGDQVDTATNEAQYANYFAPEQLRSLPVAPAVGNHEGTAPNFGWHFNVPNETNPGSKTDAYGNYWYSYNNALFVVLNTAPYPANAEAAAPYIEIMDATLKAATEANKDYDWLFVQHHKSTLSPASHQTDADVLVWAPLFNGLMDKYNVDFVLAGHDHVYSRSWAIRDNKKVGTDYSGNSITNPQGTIYFTFTTASGLKYYDFLQNAPAAPAWVNDVTGMYTERFSGPNNINGKPWYTNIGIQVKAPQFTTVDVTEGSVAFKTYRTDNMTVIDDYTVKKTQLGTVMASVSAAPESDIDGDVEFALSLRGARNVLTVEADVAIEGSMLSGIGVEAASGFTAMNEVVWRYVGGDIWQGAVTLAYEAGDDEGFTAGGPAAIAKLVFAPRAKGEATLTLTRVKVSGLDQAGKVTYYQEGIIEAGEAKTVIDRFTFPKYDLNKDGKVDALDLGMVLLYCGFKSDDMEWDTLVKVLDSKGKPVTAKMCDVNGDGVVDMLDLIDVFINYTK
ncbi:MAG: fibronectin type III domain-containing protein, partial [Clostridiales bacterium]|nr:fibronectin type III domain-containing protein [Clostridiales bacterium]